MVTFGSSAAECMTGCDGAPYVAAPFEAKAANVRMQATKRLKLLLLTDSFLPHAGGSREYYFNAYRNLVELGESEVTVLTKKIPGWEKFDEESCTETFRIHRSFKPLNSWKWYELPKGILPLLTTVWYVMRESPAILHAGDLYPQGVIAMTLKQICGLPYVVYCHGEEIPQINRFRYQPRIRDRIYKNADAVIAASEFTRQNLLGLGVPEERIHKIIPGVVSERFATARMLRDPRTIHGLEGKNIILTVARLIPRKGHRVVLQAMAELANEIPNVHYLIVGRGSEESSLREAAQELGLSEKVTFSGYVPEDQLVDYYHACDIMVMPNCEAANGDVEGFGIVFLEANAAGKPVIGGNTGGAAEAIEDGITGFLVNPNSPRDVALALKRLLLDRGLRQKMGAAGAERVRKEFNWKTRAEALSKLNRSILHIGSS
jgi:phosphatidylinositol alpha-1,6-mannosyltransferase